MKILAFSKEGTATNVIDYMMKWVDERARESTCECYGKRGIHGSLLKYTISDGLAYKQEYLTVPEGYEDTQDAKAVLISVDIICNAVKICPRA